MKADFSRLTFDPLKHYAGVLHQQGRVWLDADWNEDVFNRIRLLQQETLDIVGSHGTPSWGSGFEIRHIPEAAGPADDFLIGSGHYYVDGLLCQLETESVAVHGFLEKNQARIASLDTGAPPYAPNQWVELFDADAPHGEPQLLQIQSISPPSSEASRTVQFRRDVRDDLSGAALPRLRAAVHYKHQPDYPHPPALPPGHDHDQHAIVYLDAWQRMVTYLQDEHLREIALGGPDTTARLKTVAQVKVHSVRNAQDLNCSTAHTLLPKPSRGTLTTVVPQAPATPYTGRENRLYRVEIHDGGNVEGNGSGTIVEADLGDDATKDQTELRLKGALSDVQKKALEASGVARLIDKDGRVETVTITQVSDHIVQLASKIVGNYPKGKGKLLGGIARFKWSRDNAAAGLAIVHKSTDNRTLTLASLGRDASTALQAGDWVEITDDRTDLGSGHGLLTRLTANPDPDAFTVHLADEVTEALDGDSHPVLRRWDEVGWANAVFDEVKTPGMSLGDGVRIQFGGENLLRGDYWQIAARVADSSVERLVDAPPAGIVHHIAPLAIVRWRDEGQRHTFSIVADCRQRFESLTQDGSPASAGLCTVTVSPGESIGTAIHQIDERGGVVCLLPGRHELSHTVRVSDKHRLTVRGAGAATVLHVTGATAAFHFENCENLALEDVSIISDSPDWGGGEAAEGDLAAETPSDDSDTDAAGEPQPVWGVVTIEKCRLVRMSRCTITCRAGRSGAPARACVSFWGQLTQNPAGGTAPELTNGDAGIETGEPAATTSDEGAEATAAGRGSEASAVETPTVEDMAGLQVDQPGFLTRVIEVLRLGPRPGTVQPPPEDAEQQTPSSAAAPRIRFPAIPSTDFTLHRCHLYPDRGQSGLLVTGSLDTLISNTQIIAAPDGNHVSGSPVAANDRAGEGMTFRETVSVRAMHNLVAGCTRAWQSTGLDLLLFANRSTQCADGLHAANFNSLRLDENIIECDHGPAVTAQSGLGEITLLGNSMFAPAVAGTTAKSPATGAVADIQAGLAHLYSNDFFAVGDERPGVAVHVGAQRIAYIDNLSECHTIPRKTNVFLHAASNDRAVGSVVAVSNACREPAVQTARRVLREYMQREKDQNDLVNRFMATDGQSVSTFREDMRRSSRERWEVEAADRAFKRFEPQGENMRISLLIQAGVANTGFNILTHELVRTGRGSEYGTLVGVL